MADTTISNVDENKSNLITKTNSYITNIRRLLNEPAAKRALPTVLALIVAFVGILIFISMREPAKTTLFSSLTEADKAKVVESLRQKGIDVSLDNLTMSDVDANYVRVKWKKKDVVAKTEYVLKVGNALTVGKVFEQLDELNISLKK